MQFSSIETVPNFSANVCGSYFYSSMQCKCCRVCHLLNETRNSRQHLLLWSSDCIAYYSAASGDDEFRDRVRNGRRVRNDNKSASIYQIWYCVSIAMWKRIRFWEWNSPNERSKERRHVDNKCSLLLVLMLFTCTWFYRTAAIQLLPCYECVLQSTMLMGWLGLV